MEARKDVYFMCKTGTLVKSDNGIVMVVTKHNLARNDLFNGVVMIHDNYTPGDWSDNWSKSGFVKFVGSVVLEQE